MLAMNLLKVFHAHMRIIIYLICTCGLHAITNTEVLQHKKFKAS